MGDDSLFGLSVFQQLAIIGAIGVAFVLAGSTMSSTVDPSYSPTVTGVGAVVVLYTLARAGYELFRGPVD